MSQTQQALKRSEKENFKVDPFEQVVAIVAQARSLGLHVGYISITPGDGNCWYHTVLDQIRRLDISHLFPTEILHFDHYQLRRRIYLFVIQNQNFHPTIVDYIHQ